MGIIIHLMTPAELKGLKEQRGETLREFYRRLQVHDITDREVTEAFSN